ncbi:vertnin [Amblyraja radiata]|uniref:vertnin n=1 Tax=Amblyraja radiata TaxID=386614 RepID=UPI00140398A7|nr:vertnin [Amblyraja radiata]
MPERSDLVEALRLKLQEATECGEPETLRAVTAEVDKQLSVLPVPLLARRTSYREAEVDPEAKALYPEDAPSDMAPLACPGVGNHLFEAASTLLLGDAGLSMELQLRTMVEMLLHKQYYLKGMIDSKIMLQAARYSLCTEESARKMNLPMAILEAIFDADVKATCYPGAFTNMWHIYALASVLQSNIYSIYPMSNLKIRPYFNRLIGPRSRSPGAPVPTFHIMWAGERLSRAVFRPQYFAPVVALGQPEGDPSASALPLKTLELLNAEPDISYSVLRERYSITKSTFYRWKRQSQEHRRRAAARYEARHFLQQCFAGGRFLPLQQFRSRFPDISRSTYYAWKHEMVVAAAAAAAATTAGGPLAEAQDRDQDQARPGLPGKPAREQEREQEAPSKEAGQRSPSMQLARGFLRQCVLLNICPPYKNFRKSYPWISRSTYYNWRREAMSQAGIRPRREENDEDEEAHRHGDGLEAEPEAEGHPTLVAGAVPTSVAGAVPTSVARAGPTSVAGAGPTSVARAGPTSVAGARFTSVTGTRPTLIAGARPPSVARAGPTPIAGAGPTLVAGEGPYFVDGAGPLRDKMAVPPSLPGLSRGQREQEKARRRAQRWQVPLSVFRVRFPTIPASTFLRWRALARRAGRRVARLRTGEEVPAEGVRWVVAEAALGPAVAVETPPSPAMSKTSAKLFLQRRFISKNFPSFREFSTYFPLTPRSTYYMWKRALTNGMMLADC